MARNLSAEERHRYGEEALNMSAVGLPIVSIADKLGLNRKTVTRLIEQTAEETTPQKVVEAAKARRHYERIIRTCWTKLQDEKLNVNSHNLPALLAQAGAAQVRLDKLNGIEHPVEVEITNKLDPLALAKATEGVPVEDRIRLVG